MNKVESQTTIKTFFASGSSTLAGIVRDTKKFASVGAIPARLVFPSAAVASTASTATPVPHPGSHVALISGALAVLILITTIISVSILLRRQKNRPSRGPLRPPFSSSPYTRGKAGNKHSKRPTRLSRTSRRPNPERSTESIQLSYLSPLASSSKRPSLIPPDLHESISVPQNTYKTIKPGSGQLASSEDSSGFRELNMSRYASSRAEALGPLVPSVPPSTDSTLPSLSSPLAPFIPDPSPLSHKTPSLTPGCRSSINFDDTPLRGKEAEISTHPTAGILDGPPPAYEHGGRVKS